MSLVPSSPNAKTIHLIAAANYSEWLKAQTTVTQTWLQASGFSAKNGEMALLPEGDGSLGGVLVINGASNLYALGKLPLSLPAGTYQLAGEIALPVAERLALGWCLGADRFTRYKKKATEPAQLVLADAAAHTRVLQLAAAVTGARALVNTPAEDLGPQQLSDVEPRLHNAKTPVSRRS